MKIISWNTRALKDPSKHIACKKFIKNHHPGVVMIQESKMESSGASFVRSIWSSKDIGWEFVESVSTSGGILTLGRAKITVVETIKGQFSLLIKGDTMCKKRCWMTNVYGPCGYIERRHVWPELLPSLECSEEAWCMGGDFNVTNWACKRLPIGRNTRGLRLFNNFVDLANIMEIPLQNGRFT